MTQKELKQLIQLCQKTGVVKIKFEGVELELAPVVQPVHRRRSFEADPLAATINEHTKIAPEMTEDQLLFWSTGEGATPSEVAQ